MSDPVVPTDPNQEPLAPEVTPSAPSQDNAAATADAEQARKDAEKARMEANMLRNKLDALEKAQAERERKELEEKEDYRSLAARLQAELEAKEKAENEQAAAAASKAATDAVYSGFDAKVREIAETAGLTAANDSEEAQADLRAKLEAIQSKVGITKQPTPTPNNPVITSPQAPERAQIVERMKWDNPQLRDAARRQAIGNLESIKAMKQISGMTPQEI